MKFSKILVSAAALIGLAACNQQPSPVSEEKFAEAVAKIEAHQYATAHADYDFSTKYTFKGFTAEEEAMYREMGGMQDEQAKGSADFQWDGSVWTTNAADLPNGLAETIGTNIKDMPIEGATAEGVKLYLNPFKVVENINMEQQGTKMSINATMVFDNYGYLTSMSGKQVMSAPVAEGKTISMTVVEKVTISYAD